MYRILKTFRAVRSKLECFMISPVQPTFHFLVVSRSSRSFFAFFRSRRYCTSRRIGPICTLETMAKPRRTLRNMSAPLFFFSRDFMDKSVAAFDKWKLFTIAHTCVVGFSVSVHRGVRIYRYLEGASMEINMRIGSHCYESRTYSGATARDPWLVVYVHMCTSARETAALRYFTPFVGENFYRNVCGRVTFRLSV